MSTLVGFVWEERRGGWISYYEPSICLSSRQHFHPTHMIQFNADTQQAQRTTAKKPNQQNILIQANIRVKILPSFSFILCFVVT